MKFKRWGVSVAMFATASSLAIAPASADWTAGVGVLAKSIAPIAGVFSFLINVGAFDSLGLGHAHEQQIDRIIQQLAVIQAGIDQLKNDVTNLAQVVSVQQEVANLQPMLTAVDGAAQRISDCATQVRLLAGKPSTDSSDDMLYHLALQMVGREGGNGACDLTAQFGVIHGTLVKDAGLNGVTSNFYALLGEVARLKSVPFDNVLSHYLRIATTQRLALGLISNAYMLLGEPDSFKTVYDGTAGFGARLRDEEIALLQAADAFLAVAPTDDLSPAMLADAVVQYLDRAAFQVSTYTTSPLETPSFHPPQISSPDFGTNLPIGDTITGGMLSYYGRTAFPVTSGSAACLASTSGDGYAYLQPIGGTQGGFKISSTCRLQVTHAMSRALGGVTADWGLSIDGGSVAPLGLPMRRNAANLANETAADDMALGGDAAGRVSGMTAFHLVANKANPTQIGLTIDLPGSPGTPIVAGPNGGHAFVAGAGTAASFTRIPFGPTAPDRYALRSGNSYLAVGTDGFMTLAAQPFWFDIGRLPDRAIELTYSDATGAEGVVYVDRQLRQHFLGRTPDAALTNKIDIALGAPNGLGLSPRGQWLRQGFVGAAALFSSPLVIYPPCAGGTFAQFPRPPMPPLPIANCSAGTPKLDYARLFAAFQNADAIDRRFRVTLGAFVSHPSDQSGATVGAGVHCFTTGSPSGLTDINSAFVGENTPTGDFGPVEIIVSKNTTAQLVCQILDDQHGQPSSIAITKALVEPCRTVDGECKVYP